MNLRPSLYSGQPNRTKLSRLVARIRWALEHQGKEHAAPARELRAMVEQLQARADPGSGEAHFATRQLARLVVEQDPWRAAILVLSLLRQEKDDDELWGLLGLAHTLLGNYRLAVKAYRAALTLSPDQASHLHNLGHLLDAGMNRPRLGLAYLRRAHEAHPTEPELASSFAHALVRVGEVERARQLLAKTLPRGYAVDQLVARWLSADPPGSLPARVDPAPLLAGSAEAR